MKKLGCFFDFRVIVIHDLKLHGFLCGGKFLFHIRVGIGQDILDGAVHIGADNGLAGELQTAALGGVHDLGPLRRHTGGGC